MKKIIKPILSICIPTINRDKTIAKTLDCFSKQASNKIEIVIVDGNKNNKTYKIIQKYLKKKLNIKYIVQDYKDKNLTNQGFDRAVDQSVKEASADHCWLFTDDDLICNDAINIVLKEITKNYDLILIPSTIMNDDFSKTFIEKRPDIPNDLIFQSNEVDKMATSISDQITFVGSVLIKKDIWIKTNKTSYFGSGFIHVGVIFESEYKNKLMILSKPLSIIRFGEGQWHNRAYEIWMIDWPRLIWSLNNISFKSKVFLSKPEPWKKFKPLLIYRAMNFYNYSIYHKFHKKACIPIWKKMLFFIISCFPKSLILIPVFTYIKFFLPKHNYLNKILINNFKK